jgi:hypothetical protein
MNPSVILLANLALSFYLVGCIWAHEVDIFRNWKALDPENFHRVQAIHWRKLPFWVFAPLALALAGSVWLIAHHPARSPAWAIWGALGCQLASHLLTAVMWGPWQARLSRDPEGGRSRYLALIIRTHWIRTSLISGYAACLLGWAVIALT